MDGFLVKQDKVAPNSKEGVARKRDSNVRPSTKDNADEDRKKKMEKRKPREKRTSKRPRSSKGRESQRMQRENRDSVQKAPRGLEGKQHKLEHDNGNTHNIGQGNLWKQTDKIREPMVAGKIGRNRNLIRRN